MESFEERIKGSFIKVREDISILKKELDELKLTFINKNNDILILKESIKAQNELISKLKDKIELISTGNQRVINDGGSLLMMINDDKRRVIHSFTVEKFRHLTDREFSVFLAIYQLEEEHGAVTYDEIAHKLNITINNVRIYVNDLINRGYPIYGEREFNRKTKFRVLKEFRGQNLIGEVLLIRENRPSKVKSSSEPDF